MHIHAGNRIIVSDKKIVGIFNTETILLSEYNSKYFSNIKKDHKTIIIDKFNNCISSAVSSYTIMNRTELTGNIIWRRNNE